MRAGKESDAAKDAARAGLEVVNQQVLDLGAELAELRDNHARTSERCAGADPPPSRRENLGPEANQGATPGVGACPAPNARRAPARTLPPQAKSPPSTFPLETRIVARACQPAPRF